MTRVEESTQLEAPMEMVFLQVTDPRRVSEWNPSVIEVQDVDYPLRVGASWRQTVSVLGRIERVTCRVIRYEPPVHGELEVSGDREARLWTHCDPSGSGTRLTQGIEFEPPGGRLRALVGTAAAVTMRRELRATIERQRETLEREAGEMDGSGT